MPHPRRKTSDFTERVKKAAQMTAEEQAVARSEKKKKQDNKNCDEKKKSKVSQRFATSSQSKEFDMRTARKTNDDNKPRKRTTSNLQKRKNYSSLKNEASPTTKPHKRLVPACEHGAADDEKNLHSAKNIHVQKQDRQYANSGRRANNNRKKTDAPRTNSNKNNAAQRKNNEQSLLKKLPALPNLPQRAIALTIIIVLVVILCCEVYPVSKTYYKALRDEQRQSAILEAENARNEELKKANETLKTKEGIEDEARKSGYVKNGEKSVSVSGGDNATDTSAGLPSQIDESKIHAPQTWYYKILDAIFFVDA